MIDLGNISAEIVKQGFGYVLFVATWPVIFFLYKERVKEASKNQELADKRVDDLRQLIQSTTASDEARNKGFTDSMEKVNTAVNSTLSIVQNLQQLLNIRDTKNV